MHDRNEDLYEAERALDADMREAAQEALEEALARQGPPPADAGVTSEETVAVDRGPQFTGIDLGGRADDVPDHAPADSPPRSQRGRRRWVYTEGGVPLAEPVEVGEEWAGAERGPVKTSEEEIYGHLRATDGTVLDTRTKHRQYMKDNGFTMHSDYTEHFARAAKERARIRAGGAFDTERRREAVRRAVEIHTKRR